MPNYVVNKIILMDWEESNQTAERISEVIKGPNGDFDFNTLIPHPLQLYHGNLSGDDKEDFKCN
jgi:hypothetical protein